MFNKRYKEDDEFWVTLARAVDSVFRYKIKRSSRYIIEAYTKKYSDFKPGPQYIENLCKRNWNQVKAYPRLHTMNLICQMGGFSVFDLISIGCDPTKVETTDFYKTFFHKKKIRTPKPIDWAEFDKRFD